MTADAQRFALLLVRRDSEAVGDAIGSELRVIAQTALTRVTFKRQHDRADAVQDCLLFMLGLLDTFDGKRVADAHAYFTTAAMHRLQQTANDQRRHRDRYGRAMPAE